MRGTEQVILTFEFSCRSIGTLFEEASAQLMFVHEIFDCEYVVSNHWICLRRGIGHPCCHSAPDDRTRNVIVLLLVHPHHLENPTFFQYRRIVMVHHPQHISLRHGPRIRQECFRVVSTGPFVLRRHVTWSELEF